MAYIRDNEDYYVSIGMTPRQARIQEAAEKECGHDGGFCNPRKAKEYTDALEEAEKNEPK